MLSALLLMITERGHAESVLGALKKLDGVREAYMTHGVYDVIAKTKADTMDKLEEISRHVQKLDSVRSIQTMIVRAEKKHACMQWARIEVHA